MVLEPCREFGFFELTAGQSQHHGDGLLLRSINPQAIEAEKEIHGLKGDAFVSIDEGVVPGDPKPIGGGQVTEV